MLICPLCEESVLCFKTNSHIIPEWMYRGGDLYDGKGRTIHLDLKNSKKHIAQKGYRGSFICDQCEVNTAQLDSYASLIFKNKDYCHDKICKEKISFDINPFHIWSGFDCKKVQNFIYSICLRQHFYKLAIGEEGLIIDRHLPRILELYRSDQMDDESYPISIFYLETEEKDKYIIPPCVYKMPGHYIISFIACGFQFIVGISSHRGLLDSDIRLKYPGVIRMPQIKFEYSGIVRQVLYEMKQTILQIRNKTGSKQNKKRHVNHFTNV